MTRPLPNYGKVLTLETPGDSSRWANLLNVVDVGSYVALYIMTQQGWVILWDDDEHTVCATCDGVTLVLRPEGPPPSACPSCEHARHHHTPGGGTASLAGGCSVIGCPCRIVF